MSAVPAQKTITVYSTNWCVYCVRTKALLSKRGYVFTEVNVEGNDDKRAWLVRATGMRTVPQIFIGDTPIGGFHEVAALDRSGELDRMVRGG